MHMRVKRAIAGAATLAAAVAALPALAAAPASAAAINNGALTVSPLSGTSATNLTLKFASGAPIACPGDSATNQYFVQGFIVPNGTNLDNLTFTAIGPSAGYSLSDTGGTPLLNGTTEPVTGNVQQLPGVFSFSNNSPGDFAPGVWQAGIACTQGSGAGMTKAYWTVPLTITTNTTTGGPAQINWVQGVALGSTGHHLGDAR